MKKILIALSSLTGVKLSGSPSEVVVSVLMLANALISAVAHFKEKLASPLPVPVPVPTPVVESPSVPDLVYNDRPPIPIYSPVA